MLIIASSLAYYFIFYIPSKDRLKRDMEMEKVKMDQDYEIKIIKERENKLDLCLKDAHAAYVKQWDGVCKYLNRDEDCTLVKGEYGAVKADYQEQKEDCFKLYSN